MVESDRIQSRRQFFQQSLRLFVSAKRDAHASGATGIAIAISNENAAAAHLPYQRNAELTKVCEYKIRVTRPVSDPALTIKPLKFRSPTLHL
jgi:hypothetical protein